MSRRIYFIGTNTEIGKTSVLEAFLLRAKREKISAIPFKPAQSGSMPEAQSDAGRLISACAIPDIDPNAVAPHRYDQDKAPGVIEGPERFLELGHQPSLRPIQQACEAIENLEKRYQPQWSLCEGAGGLHVPMPGGTWQPQWIQALAHTCIIVAPTGLGTINHTLLTIQAVQALGLPILGIAWTGAQEGPTELAGENMRIVELRTGLPALSRPDGQGSFTLVEKVFELLQARDQIRGLTPSRPPA